MFLNIILVNIVVQGNNFERVYLVTLYDWIILLTVVWYCVDNVGKSGEG